MNDLAINKARNLYGAATVPQSMIGCWKRLYIRFSDGTEDTTTRVIWVQTPSGVGDIRVAASRPDLRDRRGFDDCTTEELIELAKQDCFCGITEFDGDAAPHPTASWPKEAYLFRFQPIITFPEPGWMSWENSGTCMIENAPSGSYEEDWRLQPHSQDFAAHLKKRNAATETRLYVAGDHAIYARNRTKRLPTDKTLLDLASEAHFNRTRLQTLVDCEFSYARREGPGDDYKIELSTIPWREGKSLECPWVEDLTSNIENVGNGALDDDWMVESLWRA